VMPLDGPGVLVQAGTARPWSMLTLPGGPTEPTTSQARREEVVGLCS
jgi:hypothetical protein